MLEFLPEPEFLPAVLDAAQATQGNALQQILEQLSAPIYLTDADGTVIYFNSACIGFSGRTPAVGKDKWCVTWKLFTDNGTFLPHDKCPMAEAVKAKQPIRGVSAIAERPDGTRVNFLPFPTPIFSKEGYFIGAVNIFIDTTEQRQIADLRSQAEMSRRLALSSYNKELQQTLFTMEDEYDAAASLLASARKRASE